MCRFENFLWKHFNPAEVLEEWADETTDAVFRLSVVADLDPSEILLPLSPTVLSYVRNAHEWFRTPLSERDPREVSKDFYEGDALSDGELRWVAIHIQSALIPSC